MSFFESLTKDYEDMMNLKEALGYQRVTYRYYIPDFIRFCGDNYSEHSEITKEMVSSWLKEQSFDSPNTRTRAIISLRTYTRYLASIGRGSYIIDDEFSIPLTRYVPVIMNASELKQFFDGVDMTTSSWNLPQKGYILPVLFRMIFCCGLRPAEPLHLRCEDVNLTTGDVYIRQSKHRMDRHLIMSSDMLELCKKYDYISGKREWFFQRADGDAFSTKWLGHEFDLAYRNSGLKMPKKPNTYSLRHCFATYTMMNWCDQKKDIMSLIPFLSAYMGHTEIKHTLYYVHLLPERLRKSAGIDWDKLDSIYLEAGND